VKGCPVAMSGTIGGASVVVLDIWNFSTTLGVSQLDASSIILILNQH